jgi:hypothetical protein
VGHKELPKGLFASPSPPERAAPRLLAAVEAAAHRSGPEFRAARGDSRGLSSLFRQRLFLLPLLSVALSGCALSGSSVGGNFSQHPGFASHFESNPRRASAATADEQALLERHRPQLWLPAGHAGPIDFYCDYIAQGSLVTQGGQQQPRPVTQALLNQFTNDPQAVFTHQPDAAGPACGPARALGRVDTVELSMAAGEAPRPWRFLTYHFVFRSSGLVAGLSWWQSLGIGLVGDLNDWHQLDHYTAATIVINETGQPVALMLQQHNGMHTYVVGETVGDRQLAPSVDGHLAIDVAIRSNELYPHRPGRQVRPAVDFVSAQTLPYLMGLGPGTLRSSADITKPARMADYQLGFLPPDDAFYAFAGYLGERRLLPGRDGPPGADYNTLPALKPLYRQWVAGYWREGNSGDLNRLLPMMGRDTDPEPAIQQQTIELGLTLKRLGL